MDHRCSRTGRHGACLGCHGVVTGSKVGCCIAYVVISGAGICEGFDGGSFHDRGGRGGRNRGGPIANRRGGSGQIDGRVGEAVGTCGETLRLRYGRQAMPPGLARRPAERHHPISGRRSGTLCRAGHHIQLPIRPQLAMAHRPEGGGHRATTNGREGLNKTLIQARMASKQINRAQGALPQRCPLGGTRCQAGPLDRLPTNQHRTGRPVRHDR